jgi:dolichol-phosphate mannosyltransferase
VSLSIAPPNAVCVLLPVLNEAQNVEELLDRIELALRGISYSICMVDDGSHDGTVEIIQRRIERPGCRLHLIQRVKMSRGSVRGSALHQSLLWGLGDASHQYFVEIDGDLSHRPEELQAGLGMLVRGECHIAIACKYMPGSRVTNRPWGRLMVSRVCSGAVGLLITRRVHDYSNGYRFYTRQAGESVARHKIRYASPIYLTEVLALWLRRGFRIGEFPTTYVGRNEGVSKLRLIDLFKAALAIFEVSLRYRITGFRPASRTCLPGKPATEAGDIRVASVCSGERP